MSELEKFASPFDQIKHVDDDGHDYWTGRELMPVMQYTRWEKFADVIAKAKESLAVVQGAEAAGHHFATWGSDGGRWGNQTVDDYRLTRFGAYLTAMAGDHTKASVAGARIYFAATTERAEQTVNALPDITTPSGILAMAEMFNATARQLVEADAKIHELEPKALAHDALMTADAGDLLVREAAKILGWKEGTLRSLLEDEHLIFRRQAVCGQNQWDFYATNAAHFHAVETVVRHAWGTCAHYTLHIRPQGLLLIQKRITDRKADLANAVRA